MASGFFSAKRIAEILSIGIPAEYSFTGIAVDTRELRPGDLFVALVGENQDGHAYIEQAIAKGAAGIVHRQDFRVKNAISFPVTDTLQAYTALAAAWRLEFSFPILVIAGSSGKTTSKELLAAILRGKFSQVHQTRASQNGFTGIPATLLKLRSEHEAAVIEVGIDEPDTMEQHLEAVQPTGGLLTSIGPEHLEKLIDIATVAREEGKLFEFLERSAGFVAVNLEDPEITKLGAKLRQAKSLSYGIQQPAQVQGQIRENSGREMLVVRGLFSQEESFPLPLEGAHNAQNLLGALVLAKMVGLSSEEMRRGLSTFTTAPGRSEVHQWREVKVYVDTYNANPASVTAAIAMVSHKAAAGSDAWVCLADMLELGAHEESLHRSLALPLIEHKIQHVFLFGDRMKKLAEELSAKQFHGELQHFVDLGQMSQELASRTKPGDRILLKGSRGMRMERVWEQLSPLESLPRG